ncbi:MAG: matrixin family metalloprotease [Planctomycetota bacterium]
MSSYSSAAVFATLVSGSCAITAAAISMEGPHHVHHPGCIHDERPDGGSSGSTADFILNQTWGRTATDGSGLQRGDAMTITWGFVQEGTNWIDGTSDLINFLDTNIGAGPGGSDLTQRPWFSSFEDSFERWGELSGLSYVYEPNDDGSNRSNSQFNGVLGVRADVRIGGSFRDGNSGVLASNFFPTSGGDMTLDTGDVNFYSNGAANFRGLRNVIMHEHGHGLGMSHVESNDASFLMEPFINTSFDGPQLDDIRSLHRGYGDRLEANGGNDSLALATSLGNATDTTIGIGLDGTNNTRVEPDDVDFISLDGFSDVDFFSFDVDSAALVDLSLTPFGGTYSQGPQNGSQSVDDNSDDNDLTLTIFDSDGVTQLAQVNDFAGGFTESLSNFVLDAAGTYYARITGAVDAMVFYSLIVDGDGVLLGDANRDGVVDLADFGILRANFGLTGGFGDANFNNDGVVDLTDFGILRSNFGNSSASDLAILDAWVATIPEPTTGLFALASVGLLAGRRRSA